MAEGERSKLLLYSNRKNAVKGVNKPLLRKLKIGEKASAFQQMDFLERTGNIVGSNRRISFFIDKMPTNTGLTMTG